MSAELRTTKCRRFRLRDTKEMMEKRNDTDRKVRVQIHMADGRLQRSFNIWVSYEQWRKEIRGDKVLIYYPQTSPDSEAKLAVNKNYFEIWIVPQVSIRSALGRLNGGKIPNAQPGRNTPVDSYDCLTSEGELANVETPPLSETFEEKRKKAPSCENYPKAVLANYAKFILWFMDQNAMDLKSDLKQQQPMKRLQRVHEPSREALIHFSGDLSGLETEIPVSMPNYKPGTVTSNGTPRVIAGATPSYHALGNRYFSKENIEKFKSMLSSNYKLKVLDSPCGHSWVGKLSIDCKSSDSQIGQIHKLLGIADMFAPIVYWENVKEDAHVEEGMLASGVTGYTTATNIMLSAAWALYLEADDVEIIGDGFVTSTRVELAEFGAWLREDDDFCSFHPNGRYNPCKKLKGKTYPFKWRDYLDKEKGTYFDQPYWVYLASRHKLYRDSALNAECVCKQGCLELADRCPLTLDEIWKTYKPDDVYLDAYSRGELPVNDTTTSVSLAFQEHEIILPEVTKWVNPLRKLNLPELKDYPSPRQIADRMRLKLVDLSE